MATRRRTAKSLLSALEALSDEALQCRDFGHSWRPYTATWMASRKQYDERLMCMRCKTVRSRLLDQWGQQLANHYSYADGYQIKGQGRLTGEDRDAVRLAGVQLLLALEQQSKPKAA